MESGGVRFSRVSGGGVMDPTTTNRFLITGSDFTELAILENNMNDLESTIGGVTEVDGEHIGELPTPLKVAKFKQIDWNSSKLIRQPRENTVKKYV